MKVFKLTPRRRLKLYEYSLEYLIDIVNNNRKYGYGLCCLFVDVMNILYNLTEDDLINLKIHPYLFVNGVQRTDQSKYIEFVKFNNSNPYWFKDIQERINALKEMIKEVKLLIK